MKKTFYLSTYKGEESGEYFTPSLWKSLESLIQNTTCINNVKYLSITIDTEDFKHFTLEDLREIIRKQKNDI